MTAKKAKEEILKKWYEDPVKKWFSVFMGFLSVASIGYAFARIQMTLEFRMEKYEIRQDFNEKLRGQIDDCRTQKQELENTRVNEIEEVVKNLEKKFDGNK
ncbi:hypothetical protein G7A72_16360 [Flavobacterium sp. Sr18]|uniref:hypothetical protein n=1 Tax=Flavobacterium sp. Sr18 TaxID=935222 RepID=UPI0013E471CE|nr:hypothetical protein [Flavobacterium sp. Sr18]QIH40283.1 hypothetical protein G7A72_16360 [Flavobacterium sp. Sr18]